MAKTEPVPGTSDILPEECVLWRRIEAAAASVFGRYGYGELRTPVFERSEVFMKSIGDETDIVQKEMYTFEDRGGRSLTLRPEGTASVLRALSNIGIPQGEEHRVYYLGPMFRGERPSAGRKRQFHQIGVECVGKTAPGIDVECIAMLNDFLQSLAITNTRLMINTRGVKEDRQPIADALSSYFADYVDSMCEDCQRRYKTNIWRMLDCKEEACAAIAENAPISSELMGDESRKYFDKVINGLDKLGIPYTVDSQLVRGLDYYEHTVFEVIYDGIGAQNSIVGGGRYQITPPGVKKPVPGVGFAAGIERLLLTQEDLGLHKDEDGSIDIYLVSLGEAALEENLQIARRLRAAGKTVLMDLEGRGMKAQMRSANKYGARFCYILGEEELSRGVILVKDMESSEQEEKLISELSGSL